MDENTQTTESKSSTQDKLAARRSCVRIVVTYFAAIFLFIIGPVLICFLAWTGTRGIGDKAPDPVHLDLAKDLFLTILPVSAAIVSYWFAGRGQRTEQKS